MQIADSIVIVEVDAWQKAQRSTGDGVGVRCVISEQR
jgi:hypothetical protein